MDRCADFTEGYTWVARNEEEFACEVSGCHIR